MIGTHKVEPTMKEMKKKMMEQVRQMQQRSNGAATAA
jgi:hypothetical protein